MGNTKNSAGRRIFDDVYTFPQDSQDLADDIDLFANVRREPSTVREALLPGQIRERMLFIETDTGYTYQAVSGGWVLISTRIFGRMNRANTSPAFTTTAWYNAAVNANWNAEVAQGLAAYANGWKVPIPGRYRVEYELRATNVFAAGVTVNNATPSTAQVRLAASAPVIQSAIAMVTVSGTLMLAADDVVRLHAFASTGSPTLDPERGFFSIEWVGAI